MDRAIDDIIGKGHFDAVDKLFPEDFLWHAPRVELCGREQLNGLFADFRAAFPGRTYTYELQLHVDDFVVGRWILEGDRIAEEWEEFDALGMLRQLGAVPETFDG